MDGGVLEGDRPRSGVEDSEPGLTLFSFGYKGNAFGSFGDKRTNKPLPGRLRNPGTEFQLTFLEYFEEYKKMPRFTAGISVAGATPLPGIFFDRQRKS